MTIQHEEGIGREPENPPAFPRDHRYDGHYGLTMRDWFAGQALAGLMANPSLGDDSSPRYAYFLADKMLAARGDTK